MLANIHAEKGDFKTAILHFENLPHQFGYNFIARYANYRLSRWYEKTGNWERALIKCDLLLETYRDCDPKYQGWLKETEQRKVRLITKMQ